MVFKEIFFAGALVALGDIDNKISVGNNGILVVLVQLDLAAVYKDRDGRVVVDTVCEHAESNYRTKLNIAACHFNGRISVGILFKFTAREVVVRTEAVAVIDINTVFVEIKIDIALMRHNEHIRRSAVVVGNKRA